MAHAAVAWASEGHDATVQRRDSRGDGVHPLLVPRAWSMMEGAGRTWTERKVDGSEWEVVILENWFTTQRPFPGQDGDGT